MPTWPVSLPEFVLGSGFNETPPDLTLWSKMETGPQASRRRFTAGETPITCTIELTPSQYTILKNFFVDEIASGSIPFDWVHPITRIAKTMRLKSLTFQSGGGSSMLANLDLRIMP